MALALALHDLFLAGAVIVAVGAAATLLLPEVPLKRSYHDPGSGTAESGPAGEPPAVASAGRPPRREP